MCQLGLAPGLVGGTPRLGRLQQEGHGRCLACMGRQRPGTPVGPYLVDGNEHGRALQVRELFLEPQQSTDGSVPLFRPEAGQVCEAPQGLLRGRRQGAHALLRGSIYAWGFSQRQRLPILEGALGQYVPVRCQQVLRAPGQGQPCVPQAYLGSLARLSQPPCPTSMPGSPASDSEAIPRALHQSQWAVFSTVPT